MRLRWRRLLAAATLLALACLLAGPPAAAQGRRDASSPPWHAREWRWGDREPTPRGGGVGRGVENRVVQ